MKLSRQGVHEERGKESGTEAFSRTRPLAESLKRATVVFAILTGAALNIRCGGGNPDPPPSDSGIMDSGTPGQDGGTQDAGPVNGLCTQYPPGTNNNNAFFGGSTIMKPANNSGNWLMYLKSLVYQNGTEGATFGLYPQDLSSAPTYTAFTLGQTQAINVPGVGNVSFQLCNMSSQACNAPSPGQPPNSGDVNCYATLASDMPWGVTH